MSAFVISPSLTVTPAPDGNSCALQTSMNYCYGAMSDGYDYTGAAHVLGISADDGLIELQYMCDGNMSAG